MIENEEKRTHEIKLRVIWYYILKNIKEYELSSIGLMQARVPEETKQLARKIISDSGYTVSDVIREVMDKIATERRVPLELFKRYIPDKGTLESMTQFERGEFESANSMKELFEKLNA